MREYYGSAAKKYAQTKSKKYLVNPAIFRLLTKTKQSLRLLDLACGNGDLIDEIKKRGYKYTGMDISDDMLKRARVDYHDEEFFLADARTFAKKTKVKYDVVLINMLMPALSKRNDIKKVLVESKKVLRKNGRILVATNHPCFDPYMTYGLLKGKRVVTKFVGYFDSEKKFEVGAMLENKILQFTDYHYTFEDYIKAINESGLSLRFLDECEVPAILKKTDREYFDCKNLIPTFLIMELTI